MEKLELSPSWSSDPSLREKGMQGRNEGVDTINPKSGDHTTHLHIGLWKLRIEALRASFLRGAPGKR